MRYTITINTPDGKSDPAVNIVADTDRRPQPRLTGEHAAIADLEQTVDLDLLDAGGDRWAGATVKLVDLLDAANSIARLVG